MKKLLLALMFVLPASAGAVLQGKLDLTPTVNPVLIRELHDGNWLAGYGKSNLFHLDLNGTEIFHAGVFHAWRTNQGDPSLGLSLGIAAPAAPALGLILDSLQLPQTAKFLQNVSATVAIDGYGGYRPIHGPDVHSWIYGVGMVLQARVGLPDLKAGQ